MQKLTKDLFDKFSQKIDSDTGFLHVKGVVARTGIQQYYGMELGDEDTSRLFNVYRPKEEVLNTKSLATYINATVTDEHPKDFVNTENIKELQKGSNANFTTFSDNGIDYIKCDLVITDKDLIQKIKDGTVEISVGYTQDMIKEDGVFNDEAYQYKQTNIRVNHIAIVDSARCGNACKIVLDKSVIILDEIKTKGKHMAKLKIGDMEIEVCDATATHIQTISKEAVDAKKKVADMEVDAEKLQAAIDILKGQLETAVSAEPEMDAEKEKVIAEQVDSKLALMMVAKDAKVTVDSKMSLTDMKKVIIGSKSSVSLDGKTDAYVDAAYDMLNTDAITQSQNDAFPNKKEIETSDAQISDKIFAKKQAMFRPVGGHK